MKLSQVDRLELSELVHRYAAGIDDRDIAVVVGLFTEAAELILPEPPEMLEPVHCHRGHDAIGVALGQVAKTGRTHHDIASEVYTTGSDPDTAVGRIAASAHHWSQRPDAITDVLWFLRYDDTYVRSDSGWLIERRRLTIDAIETRPARRLR